MCRIFGFRSVIQSQVHNSLVNADNAIMHQSAVHGDGWGVAYYVADSPHVIKSTHTAVTDSLFQKVSGIVASQTVLAHIRKATQGENCITNTHPFQYGRWVFVHNGNIEDFSEIRPKLVAEIKPDMQRYILGSSDSEVLFYFLLTNLSRRVELNRVGCSLDDLAASVRESVEKIISYTGPYHTDDAGPPTKTYLTFILTNGSTMIAHQGGKTLYYSTYKSSCSERGTCPFFASECEAPSQSGYVNHLLFSSEPIEGENIWLKIEPGRMIGIDWNMKLKSYA